MPIAVIGKLPLAALAHCIDCDVFSVYSDFVPICIVELPGHKVNGWVEMWFIIRIWILLKNSPDWILTKQTLVDINLHYYKLRTIHPTQFSYSRRPGPHWRAAKAPHVP
jgi:hypothetical protein